MMVLTELTSQLFLKPIPRFHPKGYPTNEWYKFRTRMIQRDNYTCQICGKRRKKKELSIHHLKPCRSHPWLCFVPDNVVTVCRDTVDTCHIDLHKGAW